MENILRMRRRLSRIVQKKGGNSCLSYRQSIEHTGNFSKRIILRGYGTAANLGNSLTAMKSKFDFSLEKELEGFDFHIFTKANF